jgi:alpha-tubulin suppressor-like RCC1 family protein
MRILVLVVFGAFAAGCLETSELSISSGADYSRKGMKLEASESHLGGVGLIKVSLNYTTPREVTFWLKTRDLDAVGGTDYMSFDRQLTIPAGQNEVRIPLVTFRRPELGSDRKLEVLMSEVSGAEALNEKVEVRIQGFKPPQIMSQVVDVGIARSTTCSILADGKVYCWGSAASGRLGTGVSASGENSRKMQVPGIPANPVGLSAGDQRVCAWYAAAVYCWGVSYYHYGLYMLTPAISLLSGSDPQPVQVDVSFQYACIRFVDGTVKCEGPNSQGLLGAGNTNSLVIGPQAVAGLTDPAVDIALGDTHTCAALDTGAVYCWGKNDYGQRAEGTADATIATSAQASLITTGAVSVTAGSYHSCALMSDQTVKCWGRNTGDYLGIINGGAPVTTPTTVVLPGPVAKVKARDSSTCALLTNGDLYCWGENAKSQLGGSTAVITSPSKVQSFPGIVRDFDVGHEHSCAILQQNDELWCWGFNAYQEINNFSSHMTYPVDLEQYVAQEVKDIQPSSPRSTNEAGVCGVLKNGRVRCHGTNTYRSLGRNTTAVALPYALTMATVDGMDVDDTALSLTAGEDFFCALLNGAAPKCWGRTPGNTTTVDPPAVPTGLDSQTKELSAGEDHVCARHDDGTVRCWGKFGVGTTACSSVATPTLVAGITDAKGVYSGFARSCAILTSGQVKCWGNNLYGTFGNGSTADSCDMTPRGVLISGTVSKLALGYDHTCALMAAGTVKCWGYNAGGQAGQSGSSPYLVPTTVAGLSNVKDIAAGNGFTCAALTSGSVKCWGTNLRGQLGIFTPPNEESISVPQAVPDLAAGVKALKASRSTICAIVEGDFAKCWGFNSELINNLGFVRFTEPQPVWSGD